VGEIAPRASKNKSDFREDQREIFLWFGGDNPAGSQPVHGRPTRWVLVDSAMMALNYAK
jgi:hypothetical protein